jgi:hypothetical protein
MVWYHRGHIIIIDPVSHPRIRISHRDKHRKEGSRVRMFTGYENATEKSANINGVGVALRDRRSTPCPSTCPFLPNPVRHIRSRHYPSFLRLPGHGVDASDSMMGRSAPRRGSLLAAFEICRDFVNASTTHGGHTVDRAGSPTAESEIVRRRPVGRVTCVTPDCRRHEIVLALS